MSKRDRKGISIYFTPEDIHTGIDSSNRGRRHHFDLGDTARKLVFGSPAESTHSTVSRRFHSIPFCAKSGQDLRIYSLYPFFKEKVYL